MDKSITQISSNLDSVLSPYNALFQYVRQDAHLNFEILKNITKNLQTTIESIPPIFESTFAIPFENIFIDPERQSEILCPDFRPEHLEFLENEITDFIDFVIEQNANESDATFIASCQKYLNECSPESIINKTTTLSPILMNLSPYSEANAEGISKTSEQ